jgi:hypothetical protein
MAFVNFTNADANALFVFCCANRDLPSVVSFLEILSQVTLLIEPQTAERYKVALLDVLSSRNHPKVTELVVLILCSLPIEVNSVLMSLYVASTTDLAEVFGLLNNDLGRCPRVCEVACALALELNERIGLSLAQLLTQRNAIVAITKSRIWFVWIVLLALQADDPDEVLLLSQILAFFSCESANSLLEIAHFIVYMEPLIEGTTSGQLLELYLNEIHGFKRNPDLAYYLRILALWNFLFHRSVPSINDCLLAKWQDSPFWQGDFVPLISETFPKCRIRTISDFRAFCNEPKRFHIEYGVRYKSDGTFLEKSLITLAEVAEPIQGDCPFAELTSHFASGAPINDLEGKRRLHL